MQMLKMNNEHDASQDVLVPPGLLRQEFPLTDTAKATIQSARNASMDIISGEDDRVLVIVGPCSIHDAEQGLAVCVQSSLFMLDVKES